MFFKIHTVLFFIFISVNCFPMDKYYQESPNLMYSHGSELYQSRLKRENLALNHISYARAAQPNVVVMPRVPNTYGGVPMSSYGVNRQPTVFVSMPNDVYNTPVATNPYSYVMPTRL